MFWEELKLQLTNLIGWNQTWRVMMDTSLSFKIISMLALDLNITTRSTPLTCGIQRGMINYSPCGKPTQTKLLSSLQDTITGKTLDLIAKQMEQLETCLSLVL